MKAGILTATRGESNWLDETIASVRSLPEPHRHVLIAPQDQFDALSRRYPTLCVLTDEGRGLYAALNRGFSTMGDCEILTWLNDDDVLDGAGARRAAALMLGETEIDVAYGRVRMMSASGVDAGELPVAHEPDHLKKLIALGIIAIAQPGTWFRQRQFSKLNGFDESYRLAGDLDFFVRSLVSGARFRFINRFVAGFRLSPSQLSQDEATGGREKEKALRPLASLAKANARIMWQFRWQNRRAYWRRFRHFGPVSMQTVYRRGALE